MKKLLIALMISLMLFGLLIPTIQGIPQNGGFNDDFNDNSLDTTKWEIVKNDPSNAVQVREQNQRLEVYRPIAEGTSYAGVVTKDSWNMQNAYLHVHINVNIGGPYPPRGGWLAIGNEKVIPPNFQNAYQYGIEYWRTREDADWYLQTFKYKNGVQQILGEYHPMGSALNVNVLTINGIIKFRVNGNIIYEEPYDLPSWICYVYLFAKHWGAQYYGTVVFDNFKLQGCYMFPTDDLFTYESAYWTLRTWIPSPPPYPETTATWWNGWFAGDSRDASQYDWRNAHVLQGIARGNIDFGKRFKVGRTDSEAITVNYWDFDYPCPTGKYFLTVKVMRDYRQAMFTWVDPTAYGGMVPFYGIGLCLNFQFKYKDANGNIYWTPYTSSDTSLMRAYCFDFYFDAQDWIGATWVTKEGGSWIHQFCKYDKDIHAGVFLKTMTYDDTWYTFTIDMGSVFNTAWDLLNGYLYMQELELLQPMRLWSIEVYIETIGCNAKAIYDYVNFYA